MQGIPTNLIRTERCGLPRLSIPPKRHTLKAISYHKSYQYQSAQVSAVSPWLNHSYKNPQSGPAPDRRSSYISSQLARARSRQSQCPMTPLPVGVPPGVVAELRVWAVDAAFAWVATGRRWWLIRLLLELAAPLPRVVPVMLWVRACRVGANGCLCAVGGRGWSVVV